MGRINLTPLRVRSRALANLETRQTRDRPVWLQVLGDIPPAQIFIRAQPQQHHITKVRTKSISPPVRQPWLADVKPLATRVEVQVAKPQRGKKKASQIFKPVEIKYEEDALRKQFYSDHPWELARPRVVLEGDGRDAEKTDWSKGLEQPGRQVSGESVVQRQLYLLQTVPDITISESYDQALREFYEMRHREDIARRVAVEEAEASGAFFGKSRLQISLKLEGEQYDDWEEWSKRSVMELTQRAAAFAGDATGGDSLDTVSVNELGPGASAPPFETQTNQTNRRILE